MKRQNPNATQEEKRERTIEFEMNYCQHYGHGDKPGMICKKGHELNKVQVVEVDVGEDRKIKWGPCMYGHTLPDATVYCPDWVRRTREMGEKRADALEESMQRFTIAMPIVNEWRTWTQTNRVAKQEVIKCPVCGGRLHLSQAAYNGHVHGKCETKGCLAWME